MAKRSTQPKQNELLLPSLALSLVVLVLVGAMAGGIFNRPTPQTSVSASNRARSLTKDNQVEDLESDLLLLREDTLDSEMAVLNKLQ